MIIRSLSFIAMLLCILMLASCTGTPATLSTKLVEIPGETPPVALDLEGDYGPLTQKELDFYTEGYEALKAEITSSVPELEIPEGATVYYVSNNGDDKNDGKSPETPWKSVAKACNFSRKGDYVLFERGSIFRQQMTLFPGVTYSSYGEGEKPRFYGSWDSSDPEMWIETEYPNIYEYAKAVPEDKDVGQIIFDHGKQWGIKVMKHNDEDIRVDQGEVFNGKDTFNNGTEKFAGYRDLKSNLEFYCDPRAKKMYLYCEYGNPAKHFDSIEVVKKGNIANGDARGVLVDNLCFMYGGSHGIGVANAKDFEIRYCEFYFIGGSVQGYNLFSRSHPTRYGNAVENWENCEDYRIHHCYASQIYDCCFTTQWQGDSNGKDVIMKDVEFAYNISEYSNTGLEVWMSDNIGYEDATFKFENFDLHHNYTVNNGYGWSHQRPNKDANFVYGGTNTNSTQHVNCVFHDNVNMFASSVGLKMRYTIGEPYGHTFRDNVYIMRHGLRFAESASVVEGVVGSNMQYYFDASGIDIAVKAGIDTNSKFRYVLEDGSLGVIDEANGAEIERYTLDEYIKYNPHYSFTASSGNSYPVSIIKPENFKETKSYPLVVYLHAEYQGGDNGTAHVLNNNPVIQNLYTEDTDDDAVILAMQLPKDATWTGTGKRDKVYTIDASTTPVAIADLNELVDIMLANEGGVNINAKKISIVGQSNGGTAVYDILTRYPDKYLRAAIAGASVAENVSIGSTELKIFHGGKDVFFKEAEIKEFVHTLSGNVSYKNFTQEDHNVWSSSFDRELCLWLIGK